MKPYSGYQLGKTYFIGYWQEYCTVLSLQGDGNGNWAVTVRWTDGHTTTHSTALGKRDKEVTA